MEKNQNEALTIEEFRKQYCAVPELSAYDFMLILFASLAKLYKFRIMEDTITNTVYEFKEELERDNKKEETSKILFSDIGFNKSAGTIISYDIAGALTNLQTFGVIETINPSFEKITICIGEGVAEDILNDYKNEDVKNAIMKLAEKF